MAFGNITTLYLPHNTTAGASLWGTDVRGLRDTGDFAADPSTKTDHGTGGAVNRTVDPYTTKATDDTEANFGWAITPSDMNSVSGARRFYPAGNHTLSTTFLHNGATGATGTLTMYVYRVASAAAGRGRTLLGSNTSSVVLPALSGSVTATCTVALAEVIFEVDETVQYSFEFNVTGIVVSGRVVTFYTGNTDTKISTPKLGVLADTTGSASGSVAVDGVSGKVLSTTGASSGIGAASGVLSATAETTGSASGSSTVTGAGGSVAGTTGSASGSGAATGVLGATGAMTGAAAGSSTVDGQLSAFASTTGSASGSGAATGILGATAATTGAASGTGTATGLGSSVAGTVGSASGSGTATGLASIVLGTVGTVEIGTGGGETTVITPVFMFDD